MGLCVKSPLKVLQLQFGSQDAKRIHSSRLSFPSYPCKSHFNHLISLHEVQKKNPENIKFHKPFSCPFNSLKKEKKKGEENIKEIKKGKPDKNERWTMKTK